ncbi:MAG TPA: adenylate/guanylate cyclase domain-containing protein [Acidimicrobiia bacterium]|jgi:predicted ATPase/class 3 adenylate cyclase
MTSLPTGTVTFLFTDLEGSTRLWEAHPDAMQIALARHDEILRGTVERHDGYVIKTLGDGFHAVFADASDAVMAAVDAQHELARESWGEPGELRARMGIHSGPAELRAGDYYGPAVNKAARVMSVGHGGQVLVSHATQELVRDTLDGGVGTTDLGEHRLRDVSRPERVFQVVAPGLRADFPPIRTLLAVPGNVMPELTPMVGRADDAQAVAEALGRRRLVTVTGSGGIGKTTLALHVARGLTERLPQGAWFCDLTTADGAASLLDVVAATLGVPPVAGESLAESVGAFLRARETLLVLDNCEHLTEPAARFAAVALAAGPGVRVLATSREPLSVEGELVYVLGPLAVPDPGGDPAAIAEADAVRVFAQRAAAARPGFAVTEENAAAIAELCRRLDGIPLALELAAARVTAMTPSEILQRIGERFRLLKGGPRTGSPRHQTLLSAIDWSYSLLDETERAVFTRLAVFAGGFDLEAAERVASDDLLGPLDVVEVLSALVSKSMIAAATDDATTSRYQMLESLRDFALERLDKQVHWRRRHAAYFGTFASEAGRGLIGRDEAAWRARVRVELDNLRAAVSWALATGDRDMTRAHVIVAGLARESHRDRASGIGGWAERAVDGVQSAEPRVRTAVLAAAAHAALSRDELDAARELAAAAIADGIPSGCPAPASAHLALAIAHAYSARVPRAERTLSEGLDQLDAFDAADRGADYLHPRATLLAQRAMIRTWTHDLAGSHTDLDTSLALARELGNPSLLADALYSAGWVYMDDDPDAAYRALEECIAVTRAVGTHSTIDGALSQAARLQVRRGDTRAALEMLHEAIAHSHRTGYRRATMFALSCTVEVFDRLGRTDVAAVLGAYSAAIPLGPEADATANLPRGPVLTLDSMVVYALDEISRSLDG